MNHDVLRMRHVTTINDALRLRHNSIDTLDCTCVPRYLYISNHIYQAHICVHQHFIHNPFLACTHVPRYVYIYNHIYQVYIHQTIYILGLLLCASMLPDVHYLTWRIHTLLHESWTQHHMTHEHSTTSQDTLANLNIPSYSWYVWHDAFFRCVMTRSSKI